MAQAPASDASLLRRRRSFALAIAGLWAAMLGWSLGPYSPYFRPWEILQRRPLAFLPERQIAMPSCGDLGHNSAIPALQRWREQRFSTDAAGLRNPPAATWTETIVLGDSYVVGSGVNDGETIPARLAEILGEPVTNYGCVAGAAPYALLDDPRLRARPPRRVVWALAARTLAPLSLLLAKRAAPSAAARPVAIDLGACLPRWLRRAGEVLRERVERLNQQQPLCALAREVVHGAHYQLRGEPWEIRRIFVGGDACLVLTLATYGLCHDPGEAWEEEFVEGLARLRDLLAERGAELFFAPIPGAGDLYLDHFPLEERRAVAMPPARCAFDRALAAARRLGLRTLDLREGLAAERFPYLFQRDDTHLSPRGCERVAALLAAFLRN